MQHIVVNGYILNEYYSHTEIMAFNGGGFSAG
jgi:hypothetical protein